MVGLTLLSFHGFCHVQGRLALEFRSLAARSTVVLNIGIIKPGQELLLRLGGFIRMILIYVCGHVSGGTMPRRWRWRSLPETMG